MPKRRFPFFILLVILVCGLYFILYPNANPFHNPMASQLQELETAKQKWDSRVFTDYRIVIESNRCKQDFEVNGDQITTIHLNTCQQEEITIPALFEKIKNDISNIEWINGIGCDVMLTTVVYDDKLGYPQSIEYHQISASPSSIGWINYVRARPLGTADPRPCTLLSIFKDGYTVTSLTPLD